jgi:hypothetical protein
MESRKKNWSVKDPLQSRSHGETLKILVESLMTLLIVSCFNKTSGADGDNTPAQFLTSG